VFAVRVNPALPLAIDSRFPSFFLPADLNGPAPNPPTNPIIDDVAVERPDLGWVTTSQYELVVPFDPAAGRARRVRFEGSERLSIPTSLRVEGEFTRTDGVGVSSFQTSLTSGVARVGSRLLVTTSNFARFGTFPALYPGTVLLFDLAEEPDGTLAVSRSDPPFLITTDPNPTALTVLSSGLVLVTSTGVLELRNPPGPGGPGSVDVVDPAEGRVLANLPLGESNPSFREIAIDASGSIAVVGSASFRELYAMDVRGLEALPETQVDPALQRSSCHGAASWVVDGVPCLRDRVIAGPGGALPPPISIPGGGRAGFVPEVRFAEDLVAATEFNGGRIAALRVDLDGLDGAAPILPDRFGAPATAVLTPPLGTPGAETGPGPMLLIPAGGSLEGSTVAWVTNGPEGTVMRGSLAGVPSAVSADSDADSIPDALDPCPRTAAPALDGHSDTDSDGVGDACDLCPEEANPRGLRLPHETRRDGQRDDDGDGRGNRCDADLVGTARVDGSDLSAMLGALGQLALAVGCPGGGAQGAAPCAAYDLDERGLLVSASDLLRALEQLGLFSPESCPGCALPCSGPACPAP
jgi:hypothetical protein